MIESLAGIAQPVLNNPYIRRVRRNHGLEHATVHVLSSRIKNLAIAGRSDTGGFWLMGNVPTDQVESAVHEALRRMQNGERQLAVHPNCGTGLVTTGLMATMAGMLGSVGMKRSAADYATRLPTIALLTIGAIILSQPVGLQLQEHFTTSGEPGDLKVLNIRREETVGLFGRPVVLHRVDTVSS